MAFPPIRISSPEHAPSDSAQVPLKASDKPIPAMPDEKRIREKRRPKRTSPTEPATPDIPKALAIAEKNNNKASLPGTPRSWFTYSRLTRAAAAADNPSRHPCRLILL